MEKSPPIITEAMMAMHTAAVRRGMPQAFIVGDLPFLSFRRKLETTMNAVSVLIRAGANAVKLEGAAGNWPSRRRNWSVMRGPFTQSGTLPRLTERRSRRNSGRAATARQAVRERIVVARRWAHMRPDPAVMEANRIRFEREREANAGRLARRHELGLDDNLEGVGSRRQFLPARA